MLLANDNGLGWFRIRFGWPQLKAYTKGEHVLHFEATCHSTKDLRCRRSPDHFAEIIALLTGMADREQINRKLIEDALRDGEEGEEGR